LAAADEYGWIRTDLHPSDFHENKKSVKNIQEIPWGRAAWGVAIAQQLALLGVHT
jgi:hypothetical protein